MLRITVSVNIRIRANISIISIKLNGPDRRSLSDDARVMQEKHLCESVCVCVCVRKFRFRVKCRFRFRYSSEIQMHMTSDRIPWTSDLGPPTADLGPLSQSFSFSFSVSHPFSLSLCGRCCQLLEAHQAYTVRTLCSTASWPTRHPTYSLAEFS